MKWFIALLALAILVVGGYLLTLSLGRPDVVVVLPERREAIRAIFATGSVRAEQMARIRTEVGGEVIAVYVRQGEEVREGDPVMDVRIDEQKSAVVETQARLREAQITVQERKLNYDRELELLSQGASTQQAVDDARSNYQRSVAAYNSIKAVLSARRSISGKGKVTAPVSGIVTKVNVNVGDIVPANVEAVTILDPASFRVVADVDELDITRIRPGQEAIVSFDAMPKSRYRARVDRIIPQADEVTKTLPVILQLTDGVLNLSDGLTASINIVQERRPNALTIPRRAITEMKDNSARFFVVNDQGRAELRSATLGIQGMEYVEVLRGVGETDRVVLDPDPDMTPGDEVSLGTASAIAPAAVRK